MTSYSTFNFPGFVPGGRNLLTGIRRKRSNLYITGFYIPSMDADTVSFLYKGNVNYLNAGGYYILNYPGSKATNLYGPAILDDCKVRVVGNYTKNNTNGLFGCMYTGKLDGTGDWLTITPSSDALNCICHSNMGNLVVGNYDTRLINGKAFIYDIKKDSYTEIIKDNAKTITAYGIWQNNGNGNSSCDNDHYTICGGYSPIVGAETDIGYIVDYNRKTKKFSNWTEYHYANDNASTVTHFDGITEAENGYNLTGVAVANGEEIGFFVNVQRKSGKAFKPNPDWVQVSYPGALTTTGNSVVNDIVIGVYTLPDDESVYGYIAHVK